MNNEHWPCPSLGMANFSIGTEFGGGKLFSNRGKSAYRFLIALLASLVSGWGLLATPGSAGPYDAPANYYNSATGTGATLKNQLRSIMSSGHIQRTYGNFRDSAIITDADPDIPGNILLVYDRASVDGRWNVGGQLPWNREHVWPQSLQPGSASNGTSGHLGDPHALRPSDTQINSNRGHRAFGFENTTGTHRRIGDDYYYPGDADRGDIARQLFYSATRYSSSNLNLVEGVPGNNQMGDFSSLLAWHYDDVPDDFERRRNHAIYSSALNPNYYTNNRNAFIDRPEYVWSVYVDQQNDSQISIGGVTPAGDGSSSSQVNLGRVIVGAAVPSSQSVSLDKAGNDGTYYEISTSALATSTRVDTYNAFRTGGLDSSSISVGLATDTLLAGQRTGTVTIDNLDVTTAGGAGRGANDGDDVIDITLDVLDHANPSFASDSDMNSWSHDFGVVAQGSVAPTVDFDLFNLEGLAGFTAGLDLDAIVAGGDSSVLSTDLSLFNGGSSLDAGSSIGVVASFDTAMTGNFLATYSLSFSDEDVSGASSLEQLEITLMGTIEAVAIENADFNSDGEVDGADYLVWQRGLLAGASLAEGDANGDMTVDNLDLAVWQQQYGTQPIVPSVASVPEPSSVMLMLIALGMRTRGAQRFRYVATRH